MSRTGPSSVLLFASGLALGFLCGACGGAPETADEARAASLQGKSAQGGQSQGDATATQSSSQRPPDDVTTTDETSQGEGGGAAQQGALCPEGYVPCGCGEVPEHGGAPADDRGNNAGQGGASQSGRPDDTDDTDGPGPCCCLQEVLL